MYEDEDTSWSFAIGLFLGAVAGAAIASLATPRSGQQNREVVLEKGVVLKDRVSDTTSSVTSTVKETATNAVTSVKDATNTAVTKVSDTVTTVRDKASSAVETVTDAASTAVNKVSETASTTVEKLQDAASTAAEKVSDVASTASEKVSAVASTASEKVSAVASTATDKARELTSRSEDTTATPITGDIVSEARYDAEDVRPATIGTGTSTTGIEMATADMTAGLAEPSASTDALHVLSSIDTFEPTMADVTASTTINPESLGMETTADVYNAQFGTTTAQAQSELGSDEQFEITDSTAEQLQQRGVGTNTVAGANADVREASEGADRGA